MATRPMTLESIILDNEWTSHSIFDSTALNILVNSGLIDTSDEQGDRVLAGLRRENVQSVYTVGYSSIAHTEPNISNTNSNDRAAATRSTFKEARVKTYNLNQWLEVPTLQRQILSVTQPVRHVLDTIGAYWAIDIDMRMSAILDGMKDITEITIGDGTKDFSADLILQARELRGDHGLSALNTIFMSSTSLIALLRKQDKNEIDELITEAFGPVTIGGTNNLNADGTRGALSTSFTTGTQSLTPQYLYNGVTPIRVTDNVENGVLHMVSNGAFAFNQTNFTDPLVYNYDATAGNGGGIEQFGSRVLYILHPKGFDFTGTIGSVPGAGKYANKGALTLAELKAGGQYQLNVDQKLTGIQNIRFKIT